jgi:hypothetical protein
MTAAPIMLGATRRKLVSGVLLAATLTACNNPASTRDVSTLTVTSARLTNLEGVEYLDVRATLTNRDAVLFESDGCTRPQLVIDSTTSAGWSPLAAAQLQDLALCVRAFNIAPGGSASFESRFVRSNPQHLFPRGVALRLRSRRLNSDADGPATPFMLAR